MAVIRKVLFLGVLMVTGACGHLLPQALEDVHRFVQTELGKRSQGEQVGIEGPPPSGGPAFHSTQTFIGTPVVIQKEIRLDGSGGLIMPGFPIHGDPAEVAAAASQIQPQVVAAPPPAPLPTGLVPPVPLQLNPGDQMHQASTLVQKAVVPANVVGPSTFVSNVPQNYQRAAAPPPPPPPQQYQPVAASQQQQRYQAAPQQRPATHYQRPIPVPQQLQPVPGDQKSMEGWVPLDKQGSQLAKGVGVKLQVDDDLRQPVVQEVEQKPEEQRPQPQPDYKDTGYSIRQPEEPQEKRNELEIIPTNAIKLGATPEEDVIIGSPQEKKRFPIYPGRGGGQHPRVVIHAQNVIIRGGPDGGIEQIDANNNTVPVTEPVHPAVKQYQAYQSVPQLNHFLRDQLRFAAMNQLLESAMQGHPLSNKPFPRPLSLREIAQAVRNGEFPQPTREQLGGQLDLDQMVPQPSILTPAEIQVNIPHMVKMAGGPSAYPEPVPLSSIQTQQKVLLPAPGLNALYKNILQQELGSGPAFDPRQPLEYALLAAMSGGRSKVPQAPNYKQHKPGSTGDYGDMVKYTTGEDGKPKAPAPIQVLQTEPSLAQVVKEPQSTLQAWQTNPGTGSLKDMSEQLLKQLLIQELREVEQEQQDQPQLLLPVGLGPQAPPIHRPLRTLHKPAYGSNSHPFAFLATPGDEPSDHNPAVFEETIEYTLPHGVNVEEFLKEDSHGHLHGFKKRPKPHYGYGPPHDDGGVEEHDADLVPLTKDTLVHLGKSALNSALEFSRHHNPLTFLNRIRELPPVKVDLYKVPVKIPEKILENWTDVKEQRAHAHHHHHHGPPPGRHHHHHGPPPGHGRRRGKKHQNRKHNKFY